MVIKLKASNKTDEYRLRPNLKTWSRTRTKLREHRQNCRAHEQQTPTQKKCGKETKTGSGKSK